MPSKPNLTLARKQRIPALALAALRMPVAFEMQDVFCLTAAMLNAVRLNGRIVIESELDYTYYDAAHIEKDVPLQAQLNAYARFPGELRIENVRPIRPHKALMDFSVFELVCTNHPDPPPGWTKSPPTKAKGAHSGIPDSF